MDSVRTTLTIRQSKNLPRVSIGAELVGGRVDA